MSEKRNLKEFIENKILDSDISIEYETKLFEEKILDSILILDLIGYIEKYIRRKLKNEEMIMSNFESINSICEFFFGEK